MSVASYRTAPSRGHFVVTLPTEPSFDWHIRLRHFNHQHHYFNRTLSSVKPFTGKIVGLVTLPFKGLVLTYTIIH